MDFNTLRDSRAKLIASVRDAGRALGSRETYRRFFDLSMAWFASHPSEEMEQRQEEARDFVKHIEKGFDQGQGRDEARGVC